MYDFCAVMPVTERASNRNKIYFSNLCTFQCLYLWFSGKRLKGLVCWLLMVQYYHQLTM